jgi:hypothetical protein
MAHPSTIYIVERHDFQHHTDEIGRKNVLSYHTTLRGANWKAKILLHTIKRDEDQHGLAQIEEDDIDGEGFFQGSVILFQDKTDDGIDTSNIAVLAVDLTGEDESPFTYEEDEEQFGDLISYQGDDSDEEDVDEDEDEDEDDDAADDPRGRPQVPESSKRVFNDPLQQPPPMKKQKTGSGSQPTNLLSSP